MGEDVEGGFWLINPAVQVFEKKASLWPDAPVAPAVPSPTKPTMPAVPEAQTAATPAALNTVVDSQNKAIQRVKLSLKPKTPS